MSTHEHTSTQRLGDSSLQRSKPNLLGLLNMLQSQVIQVCFQIKNSLLGEKPWSSGKGGSRGHGFEPQERILNGCKRC